MFILVLFVIFILTPVFSEQIAVTLNGKNVRLRDNGTWEYLKESSQEMQVIMADKELKDSLHYYIYNRRELFPSEFNLAMNAKLPYDIQYKHVINGLYKYHYKKYQTEQFYGKLVRIFSRKTADNLIWLFQHWELWKKFANK